MSINTTKSNSIGITPKQQKLAAGLFILAAAWQLSVIQNIFGVFYSLRGELIFLGALMFGYFALFAQSEENSLSNTKKNANFITPTRTNRSSSKENLVNDSPQKSPIKESHRVSPIKVFQKQIVTPLKNSIELILANMGADENDGNETVSTIDANSTSKVRTNSIPEIKPSISETTAMSRSTSATNIAPSTEKTADPSALCDKITADFRAAYKSKDYAKVVFHWTELRKEFLFPSENCSFNDFRVITDKLLDFELHYLIEAFRHFKKDILSSVLPEIELFIDAVLLNWQKKEDPNSISLAQQTTIRKFLNSLLRELSDMKDVEAMEAILFHTFAKFKTEPDAYTYETFIIVFFQFGKYHELKEVVKEMEKRKLPYTLTSCLVLLKFEIAQAKERVNKKKLDSSSLKKGHKASKEDYTNFENALNYFVKLKKVWQEVVATGNNGKKFLIKKVTKG